MNKLEERMARITLRSHEIAEMRRKRRKTILAVCTPLALCCVIAFLLFPYSDHQPENNEQQTDYPYNYVMINGKKTITNQATIGEFAIYLEKCCNSASIGAAKPEDDGDLSLQKPAQIGSSSIADTLMIEFTGKAGSQTYVLSGNTLQDKTNRKTIILTPPQIEAIRRYAA